MRNRFIIIFLSILPICFTGCIEPFSPPEIAMTERALVIDGFLNLNGGESFIALTRTGSIKEYVSNLTETNAQVVAESEQGMKYVFEEVENGKYRLPPMQLSTSVKYKLHIKTNDSKEYVSDWVVPTISPEIDDVTYKYDEKRDAMVISVNTHDATNQTKFYRWKFEQTYQYTSAFYSALDRGLDENGEFAVVPRRDNINTCWKTLNSTNITLGSTVKLSSDIIQDLPVNIVAISTNYFYQKYSIIVRQSALTEEGFKYWTSLSKTTQGTGTLFDPQPSQVTGNFNNVANPKELVFGYFSAGTESTKRIFINEGLGRFPFCNGPDTIPAKDASSYSGYMLSYTNSGDSILVSDGYCADCRVQGGINVKPSFWE